MKTSIERYLIHLIAVAVLFMMVGCKSTPRSTAKERHPPLRFGYNPYVGYFPYVIAKEKGFFAQQGVDVELVLDQDAYAMIPEFVAGKFDGVMFPMDVLLRVLTKDPEVRVVFSPGQTAGADVVMAQPGIQKISDLKGKKIATRTGSFGEIFIGEMLEQNGLTIDDVTLINADETNVPAYLQNDTIQAGYTWDPYATQAAKAGAKQIFSSKQTPGLLPDFVIFHRAALSERPDDIRAFIRAWFQAVEYWDAHPTEVNELLGKALNMPLSDISRDGYEFFSLVDVQKVAALRNGPGSLTSIANRYIKFLIQDGQLGRRPDVDKIFDLQFIPRATTPQ